MKLSAAAQRKQRNDAYRASWQRRRRAERKRLTTGLNDVLVALDALTKKERAAVIRFIETLDG